MNLLALQLVIQNFVGMNNNPVVAGKSLLVFKFAGIQACDLFFSKLCIEIFSYMLPGVVSPTPQNWDTVARCVYLLPSCL